VIKIEREGKSEEIVGDEILVSTGKKANVEVWFYKIFCPLKVSGTKFGSSWSTIRQKWYQSE
jgi:hypothetical protein